MWGGFDKRAFEEWIIESGAFRIGEYTLKSGRRAFHYVNCRVLTDTAQSLEKSTSHILDFVADNNLEPDCFYGVPDGMTKTAVIAGYRWASERRSDQEDMVIPTGRKTPKEHGDPRDRFFVTPPEGDTLVLEDVVTTGGSLLEELDKIEQLENASVVGVVVLVDRLEKGMGDRSVRELVGERGVDYYAITDVARLLKTYHATRGLDDEIREKIERYFEEYGVVRVRL